MVSATKPWLHRARTLLVASAGGHDGRTRKKRRAEGTICWPTENAFRRTKRWNKGKKITAKFPFIILLYMKYDHFSLCSGLFERQRDFFFSNNKKTLSCPLFLRGPPASHASAATPAHGKAHSAPLRRARCRSLSSVLSFPFPSFAAEFEVKHVEDLLCHMPKFF